MMITSLHSERQEVGPLAINLILKKELCGNDIRNTFIFIHSFWFVAIVMVPRSVLSHIPEHYIAEH